MQLKMLERCKAMQVVALNGAFRRPLLRLPAPDGGAYTRITQQRRRETATHRSGNTQMKLAPLVIALAAAAGAIALMAASPSHGAAPDQAALAR